VWTRKWTDVSEVTEAVRLSETSINFNESTRRYIPEDSKLQKVSSVLMIMMIMSMGSDYVPELLPPTVLLFMPR